MEVWVKPFHCFLYYEQNNSAKMAESTTESDENTAESGEECDEQGKLAPMNETPLLSP